VDIPTWLVGTATAVMAFFTWRIYQHEKQSAQMHSDLYQAIVIANDASGLGAGRHVR
jgi:predicted negative regulator of RcsB-dependent stress response